MVVEQPQLKYSQLGEDAPLILAKDEATTFIASEKLHVLGCQTGRVHLLDFKGNKIRELSKHASKVTGLALSSTLEHVASGSEDGSIKIDSFSDTQAIWKTNVRGAITCLVAPPNDNGRLDEIAVGYEPGVFSILRKVCAFSVKAAPPWIIYNLNFTHLQSWLSISNEQVIRRHDKRVHAALWIENAILWATDDGVLGCQPNGRNISLPLEKPSPAGNQSCCLARVTPEIVLVAWPHAVQVVQVITKRPRLTGSHVVQLAAIQTFFVQYHVHGIAPFGEHIALLADVSPGALRPIQAEVDNHDADAEDNVTKDHIRGTDNESVSRAKSSHEEQQGHGAASAQVPSNTSSPFQAGEGVSVLGGSELGEKQQQEGCDLTLNLEAVDNIPRTPEDTIHGAMQLTESYRDVLPETYSESPTAITPIRFRSSRQGGTPLSLESTHHAYDIFKDANQPHLQLRVVTTSGVHLTSDNLDVEYEGPTGGCLLACYYPTQYGELMNAVLEAPDPTPVPPPSVATPLNSPCTTTAQSQTYHTPEAGAPEVATSAQSTHNEWWSDADEPLYLVVTAASIALGRPCNADDQAILLLEHGYVIPAVNVVSEAPYVRPETRTRVSTAYVSHLLQNGDAQGAAKWATQRMGEDKDAWERLVFTFAQYKQLVALGDYVPVKSPRLSKMVYTAVAAAFVPHPLSHVDLPKLFDHWEDSEDSSRQSILHEIADEISNSIKQYMHSSHTTPPELQRALAKLLDVKGDHVQALELWLAIKDPFVFEYINKNSWLYKAAARSAAQLMLIDADKAITMLVRDHNKLDTDEVTAQVKMQVQQERDTGNLANVEMLRKSLCEYLHKIFQADRRALHSYHDLQVELYAAYMPEHLLPFLQSSKLFNKGDALRVCKQHNLVQEQVFILGRLNRGSEALQLIIGTLHDLPQAIAFVSSNEELWDELISLAVKDPDLTGELLDQVGGQVDPLRVVRQIPDDMELPNLVGRLCNLLKRFHATVHLKKVCNDIIDADCVTLATRLLQKTQEPLHHVHMWDSQKGCWELYDNTTGKTEPCDPPDVAANAARFAPPTHTHSLPMRSQMAAHMGAILDSLQGHAHTARIDGLHAMVESTTQHSIRQEVAAIQHGHNSSGVVLWTE